MRLYGIVLKQAPHPSGGYTLGMAEDLETWAWMVVSNALDTESFSHLYAALVTMMAPLPPLQTSALVVYLTYLRHYASSLYLGWHFDGLAPSCCALSTPLSFVSAPFLGLLFLFTVYRQWCTLRLWHMKQLELSVLKQQKDLSLLRIEQLHRRATAPARPSLAPYSFVICVTRMRLHPALFPRVGGGREKERLDYERQLSLHLVERFRVLTARRVHAIREECGRTHKGRCA